MNSFYNIIFLLLLFTFSPLVSSYTTPLPLSTQSRWIVDKNGERVKFACVNWGAHLQPMTAEGLHLQPLDKISKRIVSMGFNCVRFTWPTYLMTNDMANVTVRQSFERLGDQMALAIAGIEALNPDIIDLPVIDAFKAVLTNLQENNVMIILDNHITVPGWCCSNTDENGFFGDKHFEAEEWILGLSRMAHLSKEFPGVVGMSLRNEFRGPNQNVSVWFRNVPRGAETVHAINPKLLVVMSGFNYDDTLGFLHEQWPEVSFTGKLLFEIHRYASADNNSWVTTNANEMCGKVMNVMKQDAFFILDKEYPLFFSEFGALEKGTSVGGNRFITCVLGMLAEHDLDWNIWTLFGSYYMRGEVVGMEETFGLLTWNWGDIRNETYLHRFQAIQPQLTGPGLPNKTHKMIFHPLTGQCVKSEENSLVLRPCHDDNDGWIYSRSKRICSLKSRLQCIQSTAEGEPAKLGRKWAKIGTTWETISDSKMHLATNMDTTGNSKLCLDVDANNKIVTNACKCLSGDSSCDPESQWFKLVDSSRLF
ncbi:hypothetical protein ACFE04_008400 [Oxalis oulophora]